MTRRSYSGNAPATTLSGGINNSALTIPVVSGTGYPDGSGGPFFIVIDAGLASEEKILCDDTTGNTITANAAGRGADGTTAASHATGAAVQHVYTATDADEANDHVNTGSRDDHSQYYNAARLNTAHDVEARHTFGAAYGTPATPAAVAAASATGSGDNPAREDHVHAASTDVTLLPAAIPRGYLGHTNKTTSYSLTTSTTDVTGFTLTVTTVVGRRYKLSMFCPIGFGYQVAAELFVMEGATQLCKASLYNTDSASGFSATANCSTILTPSAGAHTYKVSGIYYSGGGGAFASVSPTATNPAYILIEDIGV